MQPAIYQVLAAASNPGHGDGQARDCHGRPIGLETASAAPCAKLRHAAHDCPRLLLLN